MHRLRYPILMSALGLLGTLLFSMFAGPPEGTLVPNVPRGSDFLSFWTGGVVLARWDVTRLYDHTFLWRLMPSIAPTNLRFDNLYPPPLYQAFETLVPLGYVPAARLYLAVTTAWMVGAMGLLVRAVPEVEVPDRRLLWGALAVGPVVYMNLLTGQLSGVWVSLLMGGVLLLRAGRPLLGGLVLGVLCVKPSVGAAVAAALVLTGQAGGITGFVLAGVAILGGSIVLDGIAPWQGWIDLMTGSHLRDYGQVPQRQVTLSALVSWPLGDTRVGSSWSRLGTGVGLLLALWLAPRAWRLPPGDPAWPLRFGLVVSAMLLALPHLVDYDTGLHGLGLLASVTLLAEAKRRTLGVALLLAAFITPVLHSAYEPLGVSGGALVLLLWLLWAAWEDADRSR